MTRTFARDKPFALPILTPEDDGFKLETESLSYILEREKIRNMKCVVISVAGAFRKGKSFMLNHFVNYLESLEKGEARSDSWCSAETVLDKFHWKCGSKQDTQGICMWSHPFILKGSDGEDVAVFLMDTQGAFDSNSTFKQCAAIFAFSTMISSLQIFNLSMNIQEDDLQHLTLFTEYAKLAGGEAKPFQQLMFLIRDWQNSDECEYGYSGGEKFLQNKFKIEPSQPEELQEVRAALQGSFQTLDCFLMPHPGLRVANNNKSEKLGVVEQDFADNLKVFVPSLFNKQRLVVKEFAGQTITCNQLVQYFEATAEAVNMNALYEAKALYENDINKSVQAQPPLSDSSKLTNLHEAAKTSALSTFTSLTNKLKGNKSSVMYRQDLEKFTENFYANAKRIVEANERLDKQKLEQKRQEQEAAARMQAYKARLEREEKEQKEKLEKEKREHEAKMKKDKEDIEKKRKEDETERRDKTIDRILSISGQIVSTALQATPAIIQAVQMVRRK